MKFNCGIPSYYRPLTDKDYEDLKRDKAKAKIWLDKRRHKTVWHRWWALWPVRVERNDCRWLEWVERRIEYYECVSPSVRARCYRAIGSGGNGWRSF